MTPTLLLNQYDANLKDLVDVMKGIPDERAAEQPGGIKNHPAWTLTHVCVANDFAAKMLDRVGLTPKRWAEIAAPGTQPSPDRAVYPSLGELLTTLTRLHDAVSAGVREKPASFYDQPAPENIRHLAPTMGHILTYLLACHEQVHLGQLQAWKRAASLAK